MKRSLASLPVRIPTVYGELSTDCVLVMERFEGVAADDGDAIDALGLGRKAIVRLVAAALILPAVREGVFHGDMHSGNMKVLADGQLGLLDFGLVCHIDPVTREAIAKILDAAVNRRFAAAAAAVLKMAEGSEVDLAAVIPEFQTFMSSHFDTSIGSFDVRKTLFGILQSASRNGLARPESLVAFFKQMLYIDGLCRNLDPKFDLLSDVQPIVSNACHKDHVSASASVALAVQGRTSIIVAPPAVTLKAPTAAAMLAGWRLSGRQVDREQRPDAHRFVARAPGMLILHQRSTRDHSLKLVTKSRVPDPELSSP